MNTFTNEISILEIIIRISFAILIGGIVGYERGSHNRPAGFRTHILVCLGAAIVSIIQDLLRINLITFALAHEEVRSVVKTDLGRLGAQVISGIGFLGAGTIMRDRGVVEGLTTAASIWVTGCIGLAIGWGFYGLAIPAGVAILIILVFLRRVERYLIDNRHIIKVAVQFEEGSKYTRNLLQTYEKLTLMNIKIRKIKKDSEKNTILYTLITTKNITVFDIMNELATLENIASVKMP